MAVALDAAADRLTCNAAFPAQGTPGGFTVTAWVRIDTDRNAVSTWLRASAADATVWAAATSGDGTGGTNLSTTGGSASNNRQLAVGGWYPIAVSGEGTAGTAWIRDEGTIYPTNATIGNTSTPDEICIGGRGEADATNPFFGSIAYVRIFADVLTQGEIVAEWRSPVPVRTTDLHSNWPLTSATDLTDTVDGRVLNVQSGGSLTSVDSPVIAHSPIAAETLLDDFSVKDTARWPVLEGGADITGGRCVVPCSSTYDGAYTTEQDYDITSSFVLVEVLQTPNQGNGTTAAFLGLDFEFNNHVRMRYDNGLLIADRLVGGSSTTILSTNYNPAIHRWWKISEFAGTIYFWTSPYGLEWVPFANWAYTFTIATGCRIYLTCGYFGTEPDPGSAIFDNLNMPPVEFDIYGKKQVVALPRSVSEQAAAAIVNPLG
jgi:hypothetical protein